MKKYLFLTMAVGALFAFSASKSRQNSQPSKNNNLNSNSHRLNKSLQSNLLNRRQNKSRQNSLKSHKNKSLPNKKALKHQQRICKPLPSRRAVLLAMI